MSRVGWRTGAKAAEWLTGISVSDAPRISCPVVSVGVDATVVTGTIGETCEEFLKVKPFA